jgi:hypothetical protein
MTSYATDVYDVHSVYEKNKHIIDILDRKVERSAHPIYRVQIPKVLSRTTILDLDYYYRFFGWGSVTFEYVQVADKASSDYGKDCATTLILSVYNNQQIGYTGAVGMEGKPGKDGSDGVSISQCVSISVLTSILTLVTILAIATLTP